MATASLKITAVFHMSFDQVFVAGHLANHPQLVPPGSWTLTVNGQAVMELEAVGEQLPSRADPATRVVAFRGQLDKTLFDPSTDDAQIIQQPPSHLLPVMPDSPLSPTALAAAEAQQRQLARQVITHDQLPAEIRLIAGVDVAYAPHNDQLVAAAVLLDAVTLEVRHSAVVRLGAAFPYVPGLFSFRELPPLLAALAELPVAPDLIICDGQGLAHPRRFGLACHLGVATGLPTIGCAKTRYVGEYTAPGPARGSHSDLLLDGEVVGQVLRTQAGINPLFVSIGHRVSLATAVAWVLRCAPTYRQPETTRAADHLVNQELQRLLAVD